jgi:glycosyltransferase involved in cell wall biosynthesis
VPVRTATTVEEARELLAGAPSPVVVVAVHDSYDDAVQCLAAITTHTPAGTAVLVVDDAGIDRRIVDLLDTHAGTLRHDLVVLRHGTNLGFVRSCNDAFAATPGRDVVVVNSDVVVGPEWLDRLTAAANGSGSGADSVATATALTNHGTILSVPHRNRPQRSLPPGLTAADAARRVAAGSLRLRPSIPTAVGHCVYIRRAALDLVGGFDESFAPGYGEEVDFSQRAVAHGLRHVCADDVFVFHRGGSSFGTAPAVVERQARHEAVVRRRHPWYRAWVEAAERDPASPLADALAAARRSLLGLTVGVDALCLGPDRMGTQQIAVASLRALARQPGIDHLVAFVPPHPPAYVRALRTELPGVEFVELDRAAVGRHAGSVDLVYRPYQVTDLDDLGVLRTVAERFVVNQLDTIAFENPAYFASHDDWLAYRDVTRLTLELAHGVAFLSDAGRRAAEAQGLLAGGCARAVVSCGVDSGDSDDAEAPPSELLDDDGFLLVLGASYLHKNRPFALEVWTELHRRGWDGRLVLAGPTPPHGNSLAREAELLLGLPDDLRADVVTLAAVDEPEKRWLYRRAALVLYPSTVEGFGLVPFEAAAHGVPTLASRRGSLDEVLPPGIPVLEGFDVAAGADTAWELLRDVVAAKELTAALQVRGEVYTWDATAARLSALFADALRRPQGRVLAVEGEGRVPLAAGTRRPREVPPRSDLAAALERAVTAVVTRPRLKQGLSPDGTRRQRTARVVIAQARRRLA